ncbi:MAG: hypothetical protein K2Q34_04310 [Alphaproteobacteria bacterium]|nr:hypothetical protein [Alphaproteobacteria bacterium]
MMNLNRFSDILEEELVQTEINFKRELKKRLGSLDLSSTFAFRVQTLLNKGIPIADTQEYIFACMLTGFMETDFSGLFIKLKGLYLKGLVEKGNTKKLSIIIKFPHCRADYEERVGILINNAIDVEIAETLAFSFMIASYVEKNLPEIHKIFRSAYKINNDTS